MIQKIKIKNFLSFRDEVVLSFEASESRFAEHSQVVELNDSAKTRLLRLGIIYGYNASGKTNLLKAFQFLNFFWSYNPSSVDRGTKVIPFRLDDTSAHQPTCFELDFFVENTRYTYRLELNAQEVLLERLSFYPSIEPVMLFERKLVNGLSEITFHVVNLEPISQAVQEKIRVECLKNVSFFVARGKANAVLPLIDAAQMQLKEHIMELVQPQTDLVSYAQKKTYEDKQLVDYLLRFLHEADFNVTNLTTDVITEPLSDKVLNFIAHQDLLSAEDRKRLLVEKNIQHPETTFEHTVADSAGKRSYLFELEDESLGTLKTFGIGSALYRAVQKNAFLPIDEIENSLHPKLQEKILYEFLKVPSRSQVLISTHNDGMLDLTDDLIRTDSIWFTEKDLSGSTVLYKLTDFRGTSKLYSIREAYRNKRFGATMRDVK